MNKILEFIKTHLLLCIIVVSVIVVVIVTIVLLVSNATGGGKDKKDLTNSLDYLGRKYYEEFYYPGAANSDDQEEKAKFLKNFNQVGMKVTLESLLKYANESDLNIEFKNTKKEECNKTNSYVIIYPKEPYGSKDYDFKLNLDCGFNN